MKVLKQRVHRSTRKLSKLHLLSEHVFGKQIVISTRNTHFDYCNNETMKKIIYFNIMKNKNVNFLRKKLCKTQIPTHLYIEKQQLTIENTKSSENKIISKLNKNTRR